jgi:hypothetical protein
VPGISLHAPAPLGTHDDSNGTLVVGSNTELESTPADYATILGDYAGAATYGTALGVGARAYLTGSVSIGINSDAGHVNGASGSDGVSVGAGATSAPGTKNVSVGGAAEAGTPLAVDDHNTAVGGGAIAHSQSTAVGYDAQATAAVTAALGKSARATHANSTAIGQAAATTKVNQVVLGTAAGEVSIPSVLSLPTEQGAPSAPASGVTIYPIDNGSGKTKLMAIFPTGAAVQLAIEP